MRRSAALAAVIATFAAPPATAGTYAGAITFMRAEPSGISLTLTKTSATVSLGPGHTSRATVAVRRAAKRIAFALPGRPAPLTFALRFRGRRLVGTVRQATARATVSLRRGRLTSDARLGFFNGPSGPFQVMRTIRDGFGSPFTIDLQTGAFEPPRAGTRLPVRQEEVRFASGGHVELAGTLTLPVGTGPFPAAAYVSGSGETLRDEEQYLGGYLATLGIATLGYDKRGVGQSGGRFPGTLASTQAISTYAADAAAAARFLAAQPEIDPKRVGLFGLSQGGWIIPVAASRAPGIVSWTLIQGGPTVTQEESDYYGGIAPSWTGPLAEAEAEARARAGGFDPLPFIRPLTIPMLWLYGGDDRAVPPDTSIAILRGLMSESPRDITIHLYPGAPHALFGGTGFPAGMFGDVASWLGGHGLAQ